MRKQYIACLFNLTMMQWDLQHKTNKDDYEEFEYYILKTRYKLGSEVYLFWEIFAVPDYKEILVPVKLTESYSPTRSTVLRNRVNDLNLDIPPVKFIPRYPSIGLQGL